MPKAAEKIVLKSAGMVSSLGVDVATACAAARASLRRAETLEYFRFRSPDDGKIEMAIGHPASSLTHGFEGTARLTRLLQGALDDLKRQLQSQPSKVRFYFCLPDPNRCWTNLSSIANDETRAEREPEARAIADKPGDSTLRQELLQHTLDLSGWPGAVSIHPGSPSESATVAGALRSACRDLKAREIETAIVIAADSLLDENTLDWLKVTGRLKTSSNPIGVQPGEAAVALYLQRFEGHSNAPNRQTVIGAIAIEGENDRALEKVSSEVTRDLAWSGNERPWFVSNHAGESPTAMEWGTTLTRLAARNSAFARCTTWFPAVSFGYTGIASIAISMCMALRAFERGYAPSHSAIITSAQDPGVKAAVLLISGGYV